MSRRPSGSVLWTLPPRPPPRVFLTHIEDGGSPAPRDAPVSGASRGRGANLTADRFIFILSDATGDTASRIVQAALKQFVGDHLQFRRFPNVLRQSEVIAILEE